MENNSNNVEVLENENEVENEKRPVSKASHIVAVRNVLKVIDYYDIQDRDQCIYGIEKMFNARTVDAEYGVDAAIHFGYITEDMQLTEKGQHYQNLLMTRVRKEGEEKQFPNNVLYIIRGLPGAGKTFLGKTICNGLENTVQIEIDDYINADEFIDVKTMRFAAMECHAQTEIALIEGKNVVVTNIFAHYKDLVPYYEIAAYNSIRTHLVELQGQWLSETRSAKVKAKFEEKWSYIKLPFRWKAWFLERRKSLNFFQKRPSENTENAETVTESGVEA